MFINYSALSIKSTSILNISSILYAEGAFALNIEAAEKVLDIAISN
jgi:hypothetical protein